MSLHDTLMRLAVEDDEATALVIAAQMNADQYIRRLNGVDASWDAASIKRVARALAEHGHALRPKVQTETGRRAVAAIKEALETDSPSSESPSES